jgi:Uma2 family endonuclease
MSVRTDLVFESTSTLTQEEFFEWVLARPASDLSHYELLHGRVVMTPPAGHPHGTIDSALSRVLGSFVHERRLGICFGSSQGFELPSGDTVEPDFAFVTAARWNAIPPPTTGRFLRIVPDLLIEILSGSTAGRDRGEKREIYEQNGVREYWIIDPEAGALTVFSWRDGRSDEGRVFPRGRPFESDVLPGLRFDVGSVLP